MKINKYISVLLIVVFSTFLFAGCKSSSEKKVIFIPQMLNGGEYWDNISSNLQNEIESLGYEYELMGADEWSAQKQCEVIKEAVNMNVTAIVLAPVGTSDLFPAFKEANKAGVPIILIDTDIDRNLLASADTAVATFVGASNYEGGKMVADRLAQELESGSKVAILSGGVDSANGESRCQGFNDEISAKGMNVVANLTSGWSEEEGYANAKLLLKAYPDLKAVFAVNSTVYKGVEKASEEYGIPVYGGVFDCDDDALKSIEEGKLICIFDQNSEGMAKSVAEVVNKLASGETVESVTTSEGKMISKN